MKKYVVVDIDGTISIPGDRLRHIEREPKHWDLFFARCEDDKVNEPIAHLVDILKASGYTIVFCTARPVRYKNETMNWLYHEFGAFLYENSPDKTPALLMRPTGDERPDHVVKPEMLRFNHITPENTFLILDDRSSVVRAWRELGFTCLQVADGEH